MDRRKFFKIVPLGALAVSTLPVEALEVGPLSNGMRLSVEKGDPGERLYAEYVSEGRIPHMKIFLNGVEEGGAVTADERTGFIRRYVKGSTGGLAFNPATGEAITEDVYGIVRIVFDKE